MKMDPDDFVLILGEIERLKKVKMSNGNLHHIRKMLGSVLFAHEMDASQTKELIIPMLQLISVLLNTDGLFIRN